VRETESERQPEHPDRDRARPLRRGKQITEERGRRRRAGRLADADAEPCGDELREVARDARDRSQQTPQEDAGREDFPPFSTIGQPAERQANDRVQQREDRAEQAERRVAERPLAADALGDAADDLAVEEIHQIDRKEYDEREGGPGSQQNGSLPASMTAYAIRRRSEEHTSELQSRADLV